MVSYDELLRKREYLNSLRKLTLREIELLKKNFMSYHLNDYGNFSYKEFLYSYINSMSDCWHITEEDILYINKMLLSYVFSWYEGGEYRKEKVILIGRKINFPHPSEVRKLTIDLISWYENCTGNLITKIALFHLIFEHIHPFMDGNGRTGRALINFELLSNGFPIIDIKTDRRYYYSFDEYRKHNDPSLLIDIISSELNKELSKQIDMRSKSFLNVI